METILGLSEYEYTVVLEMLYDTCSELGVIDNIRDFFDGVAPISEVTTNHILKHKDAILKFVNNFVRNNIDGDIQ